MILTTQRELNDVYSLVYQEYLREGYISRNKEEKYLNYNGILDNIPQTHVLGVYNNCTLIGTVSLTVDGTAKLWRLVTNKSPTVLSLLFREVCRLIKQFEIESTFQVINPKHVEFYKSIANMEVVGELEPIKELNNAPAVLMVMHTCKIPARWFS